jgi:hypothetical protein
MRCAAENVRQTSTVIEMQPVLEVFKSEEFSLWPVAWSKPFGYLPLSGALEPIEVGTAVMGIAKANEVDHEDDRPPHPAASRRPARGLPSRPAHHGVALRTRRAAGHRGQVPGSGVALRSPS